MQGLAKLYVVLEAIWMVFGWFPEGFCDQFGVADLNCRVKEIDSLSDDSVVNMIEDGLR